jgi:hypothetical protein
MDNNNDNKEYRAKVAVLESKVDMLESELSYLDKILVRCGFPQGILTLKETVEEILIEDPSSHQEEPNSL